MCGCTCVCVLLSVTLCSWLPLRQTVCGCTCVCVCVLSVALCSWLPLRLWKVLADSSSYVFCQPSLPESLGYYWVCYWFMATPTQDGRRSALEGHVHTHTHIHTHTDLEVSFIEAVHLALVYCVLVCSSTMCRPHSFLLRCCHHSPCSRSGGRGV